MPIEATPSFCAAAAIGPTGNPTTPKRWFMPCCLRLLATNVAPSTSAMLFLLFDGRTHHVRWRRTRRAGDYAFMSDRGRDPARSRSAEGLDVAITLTRSVRRSRGETTAQRAHE